MPHAFQIAGSVNVVRFAPATSRIGSLIATGSDSRLVCIYELRPGPGRAIFGVTDKPNVENWTQVVFSNMKWSAQVEKLCGTALRLHYQTHKRHGSICPYTHVLPNIRLQTNLYSAVWYTHYRSNRCMGTPMTSLTSPGHLMAGI
eukprot:364830-Chlamydomonas_euryale.AAC.2